MFDFFEKKSDFENVQWFSLIFLSKKCFDQKCFFRKNIFFEDLFFKKKYIFSIGFFLKFI